MYTDQKGKTVLECDRNLLSIMNREPDSVLEEEVVYAIRNYSQIESLKALGIISIRLYNKDFKNYETPNNSVAIHPSGVFITQFGLEYLANLFLLNKFGGHKNKTLDKKDNVLSLLNVYSNNLIAGIEAGNLFSILIAMHYQQMRVQRPVGDLISRQFYLFHKIAKDLILYDGKTFDEFFTEKTGLTLEEYFTLSVLFFGMLTKNPSVNLTNVMHGNLENSKIIDKDKAEKFTKLHSLEFDGYRPLDRQLNKNCPPEHTKSRFNPLWKYPLINLGNDEFLNPSLSAYIQATLDGLFWWFDTEFMKCDDKKVKVIFRQVYGKEVFEKYVGEVLEQLFPQYELVPEFTFGKPQMDFSDWSLIAEDKVYLFEAKAYRLPLPLLRGGAEEDYDNVIKQKVVKPLEQMFKLIKRIDENEELKDYRDKEIIPFIIFDDIPLISSMIYRDKINKHLKALNKKYPGIADMDYYLINLEDLEFFYQISDLITLEEVLGKIDNHQVGFHSICKEVIDNNKDNIKDMRELNMNVYRKDYLESLKTK